MPPAKEDATVCMTWPEFLLARAWMLLCLTSLNDSMLNTIKMASHVANVIFKQGKENFSEGLQLFDLEKANILAGQVWAEKNQ